MSAATVTMTPAEAAALRQEHDAHAKRLSRMSALALALEERRLMQEKGIARLHGALSKDEYISSVLALRGYGTERLNEATHILGHADVNWPDCPYCAGGAA